MNLGCLLQATARNKHPKPRLYERCVVRFPQTMIEFYRAVQIAAGAVNWHCVQRTRWGSAQYGRGVMAGPSWPASGFSEEYNNKKAKKI